MKINLTINASTKVVRIDYLKTNNTAIECTDYITFSRVKDVKDGWWFDRLFDAEYNRKLNYADIVNLNGSPITASQAEVTALLVDVSSSLPDGTIVTLGGDLIVMAVDSRFILTTNGYQQI